MKVTTLHTVLLSILLFTSINSNSYATPVNINQADASSLEGSLSGIGKYKARAIINYRKKNGLFKQAIDIVKVKGIGKATYQKNQKDILIK